MDSEIHCVTPGIQTPRTGQTLRTGFSDKIPTLYQGVLFLSSAIVKSVFNKKLNQQIFNAIAGLFTYQFFMVKSGYLIVKNV